MKNLEYIWLKNTAVTDLTPLRELQILERVSFNESDFTYSQIKELKKALPNCKVGDEISADDF